MMPAIYDNGTNYVTNQKLTLEMLKEISDSEDTLEVTGEYTGSIGGYGPSHEHLDHKHTLIITIYRRSNSNSRNTRRCTIDCSRCKTASQVRSFALTIVTRLEISPRVIYFVIL